MKAVQQYERDDRIWSVTLVDDDDRAVEVDGDFAFYGSRSEVSMVRSRLNKMIRAGKTISIWPCYKDWTLD